MASTTSAAASMLLSGSSTSSSHISASFGNGLSFSDQFNESRPKQMFSPPSHASPHMFSTITLDLTSSAPSSSSTQFHRGLTSTVAPISNPRSSPSLSFCSPEHNFIPSIWGKGFHDNATTTTPIDKIPTRPIMQPNNFQQHFYQQCTTNQQTPSREALAETITKAISTDPSFRSVIAAAVSSIVESNSGKQEVTENVLGSGLNLKLGEHLQLASPSPLTGYFKSLASKSSEAGNFILLQPPLPFSFSKNVTNQINRYVPEMNTHH